MKYKELFVYLLDDTVPGDGGSSDGSNGGGDGTDKK